MGFWSKLKNVVKGVVRAVVKVVVAVVHAVIGAIGSIFLFWMTKKIRLHVCILQDGGKAIVSVAEAEASIQRAAALIRQKFDTKVIHYGKPYVQIIKEQAPATALGTQCSASGYFTIEYGEGGSFFAKHTAGWNAIPITVTHPVTIFVVKSIKNGSSEWRGCSSGFMTDYVLVTEKGLNDDTTLTHEIAHACNLLHRDTKTNLLYHGFDRGTGVTGWQKWAFRISRHVNFW